MIKPREKINEIPGLFNDPMLPRLGKIRLGIKKLSAKGKEYPAETDYFVCPPEVQRIYGEKPKSIKVLFPVENLSLLMPHSFKWYGSGAGLKCYGDGVRAYRRDKNFNFVPVETIDPKIKCYDNCPQFNNGDCSLRGHILVILPEVNYGGVYQIDTGSVMKLKSIMDGLNYVQGLCGRFSSIVLDLQMTQVETHHEGKKQVHFVPKILLNTVDPSFINRIRGGATNLIESAAGFTPMIPANAVIPAPIDDEKPVDTPEFIKDESEELKTKIPNAVKEIIDIYKTRNIIKTEAEIYQEFSKIISPKNGKIYIAKSINEINQDKWAIEILDRMEQYILDNLPETDLPDIEVEIIPDHKTESNDDIDPLLAEEQSDDMPGLI